MLDQPNNYCPCCARPLAAPGPGVCDHCGFRYEQPFVATIHEMLSGEKKACQACHRSIAAFARVCERCQVIQDPVRPAPRPLPQTHQSNLDHRSYEDNYLYVVLPPGVDAPEPAAILEAIQATDLQITDVAQAEYNRGHRPRWEWRFFADNPDRPTHGWEADETGVKPRSGERIHIWLEATGLAADMGLVPGELDAASAAFIKESTVTIGLHCDTTDKPSWNTLLMMRLVRCVLPETQPLVIEKATGRILPEIWREAAEIKPPRLQDCYTVRDIERDGLCWMVTRGLPRWGCFELEIWAIPAEKRDLARGLIDAVVAAMVPMKQLPPPWRVLYFKNGAAFAWVPFEHVAERLPRRMPGALPLDRKVLKHATIGLVSPYFGQEIFSEIDARPAPPTKTAPPPPEQENAPQIVQPRPSAPKPMPTEGPNPVLVALASLLLPGVGQLWLGQTSKGAAILVLSVVSCGGLGLINLLAAVDGWQLAGRRLSGDTLGEWEFFWSRAG